MENNKHPLRVIISGGGTGGHIFPAVSIANALKRRDPATEILFVGAEGRMEMERVPAAGYEIVGLPVAGFDRKRLWRNFKVIWKFMRSRRMASKLMKDFQPDIAVGVGGYASGPTLSAAQAKGVPTLIQEQNSYPGVTNKHLAPKARKICVAYDGTERFFPADRIVKTGNPVREAIATLTMTRAEAKRQLGFDDDKPLVVVVGGSLGARTINESVMSAMKKITSYGANILWQTGKYYADECQKAAESVPGVIATPFVDRMEIAYRAADLVVSRAGASTISEIQLLGVPSILVPSPNVAEDHQRKNAQALVDRNAAVMILDADCRQELAGTVVELLKDPRRREDLGKNAAKMALRDADEKIVDEIYSILNRKCTIQ